MLMPRKSINVNATKEPQADATRKHQYLRGEGHRRPASSRNAAKIGSLNGAWIRGRSIVREYRVAQ
ncbi:uncharacterized protein SCHCODRAFT_01163539 [Schizophyllum commune H4-8]|uniref:uncharacterized protein n=1 Tax=Schizophyllum commune (strain H4-8 / FGSC 9210) TaxID=578458 RepID=UPI00215F1EDC|nr:uncharacterized protein SCHCODRAFT_01163539 [Schizophyllum commune H4-8]KAI5886335.1 hypothetical protein SCHCODRAFT_01163539 [Schizophyllum commune H4-8]